MPPVSAQEDYPSGLKLTSIMVGLCLAVFLVALDNTIIATCIPRITDVFPCPQRHWLVRLSLSTHNLRFPVTFWEVLHPLQHQARLPACNYLFRDWFADMRRCTLIDGTHRRPSDCWAWGCRHFFGCIDHYCAQCSAGEASELQQRRYRHVRNRVRGRTTPGRRLDRPRFLALVLLHQFAYWCCYHSNNRITTEGTTCPAKGIF
jgi:hypothetical protein